MSGWQYTHRQELQLDSELLSMLVKVLHSPSALLLCLLREQEEGRQACGWSYLWFGNLCDFLCDNITWGLCGCPPVPTQMHNFTRNCKPTVWGFSMRAASSCLHCSVIQKSSHLWHPSGQHRTVVEKCHLQVDHHPGQLSQCISGHFWIAEGYPPYTGITEAKWMFTPGRLKL